MIKIDINQTFYEVANLDPRLRSLLVEFGFKPMANDVTFNTVGRMMPLNKALQHIGKSPVDVETFLKENGMDVEVHE